jgi:anti-sigma B factor antagonist
LLIRTPAERRRTGSTPYAEAKEEHMNIAPFNVERELLDDGVGVFSITGELDQATADDLRGPLQEAISGDARAIVIDMTECGFIDSTGLGVIVEAWKLLQERNGNGAGFAVCCPEPEVKRLLEVTGLDQTIAIRATREEAIGTLRP